MNSKYGKVIKDDIGYICVPIKFKDGSTPNMLINMKFLANSYLIEELITGCDYLDYNYEHLKQKLGKDIHSSQKEYTTDQIIDSLIITLIEVNSLETIKFEFYSDLFPYNIIIADLQTSNILYLENNNNTFH